MRINKYLADAGVCSRREADRMVSAGRVSIDGKLARLGDEVLEGQEVFLDERPVSPSFSGNDRDILLYNKPEGLICSASDKDGETVLDHINYPRRLFYAGRLDKASRGLLILTNDGQLANDLMRSRHGHEREYMITCNKAVDDQVLKELSKGVFLPDLQQKTKRCRFKRISDRELSIVLKQGLNRQIRRMFELYDIRILDLCRVRIENLCLGRLREGTYRRIKPEEKQELLLRLYGR